MGMSGMSGMSAFGTASGGLTDGPEGFPLPGWPKNGPSIVPGWQGVKLTFTMDDGAKFTPKVWHPMFLAQAVLAEFGASGWQKEKSLDPGPWQKMALPGGHTHSLREEIQILLQLADTVRPQRLKEIVAQSEDAGPYWGLLLNAGPAIRPATWTLVCIGQAVGLMVAMHFKYKYQRARPSQVYPGLMPPIITPPHPSYPNAHALQSFVMSGCAALACPGANDALDTLADRVGHNREIAGMHFPSDTAASRKIAPALLKLLGGGEVFKEVLDRAKQEWGAP